MEGSSSKQREPGRSRVLVILVVISVWEVMWYIFTYPLVATSAFGVLSKGAAGLVVGALIFGAAKAIHALESRSHASIVFRISAVLIACSVGVIIFAFAWHYKDVLAGTYHDWSFFMWGK